MTPKNDPKITSTFVRGLFDYVDGQLIWKVQYATCIRVGWVAGSFNARGYGKVRIDNRHYQLHRLIWLHQHGEWPSGYVDHIDGNPRNNRIENLRDVSVSVNGQNQRRAMVHNTCGFLGVTFEKQTRKFKAHININGRPKTLGRFPTAEEAHRVYLDAKRQHHAGCTV